MAVLSACERSLGFAASCRGSVPAVHAKELYMSIVVVLLLGLCRSRRWCGCSRVRMYGAFRFGVTRVPFLLFALTDSAYTLATLSARWQILGIVSVFCMVFVC